MPRRSIAAQQAQFSKKRSLKRDRVVRACAIDSLESRRLLSGTAPTAPQHVTVSNTDRTHSVVVSWDQVTSATVYSVRMIDGANWRVMADVNAPTHSFVVSGLDESSTHTFAVIAKNGSGASPRSASVNGSTSAFKMFDNSNYANGVDPNSNQFAAAGMIQTSRSYTQYQQLLIGGNGAVNYAAVQNTARESAGLVPGIHYGDPRSIVMDFEPSFAEVDATNNPRAVDITITKMVQITDAIRAVWNASSNPAIRALKIGAYGLPVMLDRSKDEMVFDSTYLLSHRLTINGASRRLVDNIDYFTACAYVGTTDASTYAATLPGWLNYSTQFGDMFNKPVYSFVWPNYFEATETIDPINSAIDPTYWRMILDLTRENTDGAILWSSATNFHEDAPWWTETKDFLSTPKGAAPAVPTQVVATAMGVVSWKDGGDSDVVYVGRRNSSSTDKFTIVGTVLAGNSSFRDTTATAGQAYDYQVWAVNTWGQSAPVNAAAIRVGSLNGFGVVDAGNTVNRNRASGGFWSNPSGQGLFGMNQDGWAHYALTFNEVATQFNFKAATIYDASQVTPLTLWIDPVMVNSQPTAGTKTQVTQFKLRKTGNTWTNIANIWQSINLSSSVATGKHDIYIATPSGSTATGTIMQFQFGSDMSLGPAQPRELHATSQGKTARLRWSDWSSNETGYVVQASTDGVNFKNYAFVPTKDVNGSDKNGSIYTYNWTPPTDADYTVQVRAVRGYDPLVHGISYLSASDRSNREIVSTRVKQGVIQAENYDEPSDYWRNRHSDAAGPNGRVPSAQNILAGTGDGTIIRYRGVDFGAGSNVFNFSLGTYVDYTGNNIEVWIDGDGLDRNNKPLDDGGVKVGTLTTDYTGGWDVFKTESASIKAPGGGAVTGVHDVYLKFNNPRHDRGMFSIAQIDWISTGAVLNATGDGGGDVGGGTSTGTGGAGGGSKTGGNSGGSKSGGTGPVGHVFSTQKLSTGHVIDLIDA